MNNKEEPKQELPQLGTKEFNDLASVYFGGNPKKETDWEEQPKQETLEEAAKLYIGVPITRIIDDEERYYTSNIGEYDAFIQGAKWQAERMYSEEDMKSFGQFCADYDYRCWGKKTQEEMLQIWLEEFKKK